MSNREIKTIKLSNCEVDILTAITWGEKESIEGVMIEQASVNQSGASIGGKAIREAKYKALEVCIQAIRHDSSKESQVFTREWMDALSLNDGQKLYDAVNAVTDPKKK